MSVCDESLYELVFRCWAPWRIDSVVGRPHFQLSAGSRSVGRYGRVDRFGLRHHGTDHSACQRVSRLCCVEIQGPLAEPLQQAVASCQLHEELGMGPVERTVFPEHSAVSGCTESFDRTSALARRVSSRVGGHASVTWSHFASAPLATLSSASSRHHKRRHI